MAQAEEDKRIMDATARVEYGKRNHHGHYIGENLGTFQKHLYRYLLDYTENKGRVDVLANKENGTSINDDNLSRKR